MGKDEHTPSAYGDLKARLKCLPQETLLNFRRAVALMSFAEAISELELELGGQFEGVVGAVEDAGQASTLKAISGALGPNVRCFKFDSELIETARNALQALHEDKRTALKTELLTDKFFPTLKKYLGRDCRKVGFLSRTRVLWLLGVPPADEYALEKHEGEPNKNRKRKQRNRSSRQKDDDQDNHEDHEADKDVSDGDNGMVQSCAADMESSDSDNGDVSATAAFLKAFRQKQKKAKTT